MDLPGDILFAAEAPSHELPHDSHPLLWVPERPSHLLAIRVGDLRTDIDFHLPIGGQSSNAAFRFQEEVVGSRRLKSVFKYQVRFIKTLSDIPFTDPDVFEQVASIVKDRRFWETCFKGVFNHHLRLKIHRDKRECP